MPISILTKKAQAKRTASESDYVSLLGAIHPALGRYVDAGVKAAKVTGDLAAQKINLAAVSKKLVGR